MKNIMKRRRRRMDKITFNENNLAISFIYNDSTNKYDFKDTKSFNKFKNQVKTHLGPTNIKFDL